jgi:PAS domain S-box-containing protein
VEPGVASVVSISSGLKRAGLIVIAAGFVGALTYWYVEIQRPANPGRVLRIGFENAPPVQVRTTNGFAGLAVDLVNEAAKRAGVSLQWVETGTSSEEAFRRGLVDLWPIMADLPDRHRWVHITRPYLHTTHALVLPASSAPPDHSFGGRIAVVKMPLHLRLVREAFPKAQLIEFPDVPEILKEVCTGTVDAAFLEDRWAMAALREKAPECTSLGLRVEAIPGQTLRLGIASTFQTSGAADKIRAEIGGLFRDGTFAATIAKYSYYGLDDTWITYALLESAERARWMAWGISGVILVLGVALWQVASLRQRNQFLAAIRQSDERFRRVFEEGPLGLGLVGKDYRFLKANSALCQMVGYSEAELKNMSFGDITHPDDLNADLKLAEQLFRGEVPFYRTTKRCFKKNGEIIWINLTASLVRDRNGNPIHGIAMIEDITEARRTQEEMHNRQKLESLGVLARGIAHDFNNLLGGILAQAELLESESELPRRFPCEEIQSIKTSVIRGSEMVRELMVYSGRDKPDFEPVDVSRLVEEMMELLKISISKHATLKLDLDVNLPAVRGHAPQIRQMVMNLVINASEAIGDIDGVISVGTSHIIAGQTPGSNSATTLAEVDYVRLEVSDTGIGMTEEVKAKVFDPFFTTKFAGRGLGLAVVQGVVRAHAGAIDVVSAPDEGTTMRVFLPCSNEKATELQEAIPSAAVERSNARDMTILVVEDEEILRVAISKALRKRGLSVMEARDGSIGMDLLRARMDDLDAVLLDATIPGRSSREILEEAKRTRPDLKVIVTSAYGQDTVDASFTGMRVDWFIQKPFQLDDVVRLLADTSFAPLRPN